jgi:hypothetical protein
MGRKSRVAFGMLLGWFSAWSVLGGCSASSGSDASGGSGNAGGGNGGSAAGGSGNGGSGGLDLDSGSGGTTLGDGQACESQSQTADNKVRPVDVIFAVDTSDSMVNELQQVEAHVNNFVNAITNVGIDVHVVLIARPGNPTDGTLFNPDPGICLDPPLATGTCPGGSKPPLYQHVEDGVGSNNALDKFIDDYPQYKQTLRQDAVKYFAVVSDDNATDGPINSAGAFVQAVNSLDPGWFDTWKFFGIFCTGSCGVLLACAATGSVYIDLVSQTGGVAGDLCGNNQNFQPVFDQMSQAVVAGKSIDCAWNIPPAPAGQKFQQGLVNVNYIPGGSGSAQPIYHVDTAADCGASGGWYYDDNANPTQVLVCPSTCSAIQANPTARVDVLFGCQTIDVPK